MTDFTYHKLGTFNFQVKDISGGAGTNYAFAVVPVDASGNVIDAGSSSTITNLPNPVDTNTGASSANTIRTVPASNSTMAVTNAGTFVTQSSITGTLPAYAATPTFNLGTLNGAATAANQTTMNTTLGSPFQAGGSIGNTSFGISGTLPAYTAIPTFKIDQTTPGTTNAVSITNTTLAVTQSGTWSDTVTQATAANLNAQVVGSIASGSADSGNPIKIGGIYNSTLPTFTTGQRGDIQLGSKGLLLISGVSGTSGSDGFNNSTFATLNKGDNTAGALITGNLTFNGTNWDRNRSITGALNDGTGLGVAAVEQAGALFNNITTATTTTVKSSKGILHSIIINNPAASATITMYDNTAGSGTKIGTITNPVSLLSMGPLPAEYNLQFTTGLTIVTTGTQDITVVYR